MKNNFDKILNELSYKVSTGIPDLRNEQHLIKLWDILKEHNWSIDARVELLKRLDEQGKERLCPICEAQCQQGQNPGRDNCVAASGAKGTGKSAQDDEEPTDKPTKASTEEQRKQQRQEKATKNADNREKVNTKDFSKEEMETFNELAGDPPSLKSLEKAHKKIIDERANGVAGMGGPVASQGEIKFTEASNQMSQRGEDGKTESDRFLEDNKEQIQNTASQFKSGKIGGTKRPNAADKDSLRQLGFEEPYSDEAYNYLAAREVWSQKELEKIKKDKDSVFYKEGKKGFKGDDDAYLEWMRTSYDGGVSTTAHLEESKLDTSKDHMVTQATPEGDKVIEAALQSKYDEHKAKCGSGTKESCEKAKHYARELKRWDEFKGFHDTYAIGQDEDGNMVYIPISNKKGSNMKDPQNNTTPAQRLRSIRKQFGEKIAKNVATVIDNSVDEVSNAAASTVKKQSKMKITEEVVEACDEKRMSSYMSTLDEKATDGKHKFSKFLQGSKPPWEEMTTKQKLEKMQEYQQSKLFDKDGKSRLIEKEDGTYYKQDDGTLKKIKNLGQIGLPYEPFGKIAVKLGEFKVNEETSQIKQDEKDVVKNAHTNVTKALFKEDEPDGFHPDTNPDANNGKNTQAYISGILDAIHADTYIDMEDDEDYDVLVQMGINGVRPSHVRECLAERSGFKGDVNAPGGREELKKHLRERCRVTPGDEKVSVVDSEGNEQELFNDQWRTAGTSQKVATHFGQGMIDCMTKKVQKK